LAVSLVEIGRYWKMQIRKTLVAILAVAVAVAFSPIPQTQAASLFGPSSEPTTESLTYTVKAKAKKAKKGKAKKGKAKGKKAKGKKAKSKGPGRCGTGMYWDKKKRSCASK
jgi:hypothetical protein